MDQSRSRDQQHRRVPIVAVLLAGCVCVLLAPSLVRANAYHDFLCRIPYGPSAGRVAPADDVSYAFSGTYVFAGDGCPGGGPLYASMEGDVSQPVGTVGSVAFNAPAGLTITGFTVWRYEADGPFQSYGAPVSNLFYSPGPVSVQGLCAQSLGCSSRGTLSSPFGPSNAVSVGGLSGVTQIQWTAGCSGGEGGVCPESGPGTLSSQYDVYAADIDLVDQTPPTVSGLSGPLVSGGTLTGEQSVSFTATDGQSGVDSGSLIVDGQTVVDQVLDTNGGACQNLGVTSDGQRSFEHAQPCKSSVSASLALETNQLAAGKHSLELVVDDAAGNRTIAYNGTITTSGPPTIAVNNGSITGAGAGSGGGNLLPDIPNGQPCAGEAIDLTINGESAPIIAYGKSVTVRGVLHCGTVPIRDARVLVTTVGGPPSAAVDTAVQTALDGSFVYQVPVGPDRTLRFFYVAYSDDPGPSAQATATIMIRPTIKLRIVPRRTVNEHTINWTGTVAGGPYPQAGVTLDIEVREGGRWRIFGQVVTNPSGQFRYSYHFHATTQPTTYTFRVALPKTGAQDYPYTPGASNTVRVHVAP
jgi:hypothetical protein